MSLTTAVPSQDERVTVVFAAKQQNTDALTTVRFALSPVQLD